MTLQDIQETTMRVLSKHLQRGESVALVDFPNHGNSGDSLIYLGQLEYLSRLGVSLDYVADASRYSAASLRKHVPEGPILIHGGGNFGDRWLAMQAMRERVISDFPERRIIQLPQGIEFSNGPVLEQAQTVLGKHRHLTLLIRDHSGVKRTKELFPTTDVEFCPDMAFGFGEIDGLQSPRYDAVVLKREDSESITEGIRIEATHLVKDWGLEGRREVLAKALRAPGALMKRLPTGAAFLYPLQRRCYDALAQLHVRNAIEILAQGKIIVTDRLHATVMAGLMGKPVIATNNANGKISAIYSDYLNQIPGVQFAASVELINDAVQDALYHPE